MGRIYVYELAAVPDCTHHRLVTLCGGNVRDHVFRAHEHLLRMVANLKEGQLTLAFRFLFDPHTGTGLQNRLRLQLAVKIGEELSEEIVKQIVDAGPLCEFFEKKCRNAVCGTVVPMTASVCGTCSASVTLNEHPLFELDEFPHVCEIIRQEDRVEAEVPRELNRYVPSSGFYYSPIPFEARQDNDYLMLDAVLSKIAEPCVIEFLVTPVEHTPDLHAHDKYVRRLMAVNQYGDDVYLGQEAETHNTGFVASESDDRRRAFEQAKKKDPVADEILREQQEFHRTLRQPQLLFHTKAFAAKPENALMLASAVAESGFSAGKYQLLAYGKDAKEAWRSASHEDSRRMNVSLQAMYPRIWSEDMPTGWRGLARLCRLATVDELKGVIRFPVGGYGSPRCIRKSTDPETQQTGGTLLIGDDLESETPAGRTFSDDLHAMFHCAQPSSLESRLPLKSLAKHMFVSGVPGSGKTTAVFNLLVQLYREGIPFLVIEPAKTEYRVLKTLQEHPDASVREMSQRLRVYTPGNEEVSPLRYNPLAFPEGITLDEHIGQVLACFEAAMPMGGPLQALIAEAVEEVYQGRDGGDFPQMTDLLDAARRNMDAKGYEGEVKSNLQAAIEVRLGMLTRRAMGRIFQCQTGIPAVNELLEYPTIIEMDYLSRDHACLLALFLLAAVREQIRIDPKRRKPGLHHVTVIEEAHNIVGRSGAAKASEEIADPKAFAAQYVSRMLAELRALGEGIVIADQLPSAVASEVVKNTGTKLAHRLVSNEDREYLGGAMLLGETETEEVARLSPGEAYFYTEGLYRPRRVRCLNANAYLRLSGEFPTGSAILPYVSSDDWFVSAQAKRNTGEAKRVLSEMIDTLENTSYWSEAQAHNALAKMCDDWRQACTESTSTDSETFQLRSEVLLEDCQTLQECIADRCRSVSAMMDDRVTVLRVLADGDETITSLAKESIQRWNQTEQPQLLHLFDDVENLESRIREMRDI